MSRLDWRKCKKVGSDGSNYDPFEGRRPWQGPPPWSCGSMNGSELRKELARLKRKLKTIEQA